MPQGLPFFFGLLQLRRRDVELRGSRVFFQPSYGCVWKCCVPLNPMVLLIIIPIKWLFHWEYTLFSDTAIYHLRLNYWCVLRRVAGWVAGGCCDDEITSDDWDHSRKFPAFSTSKYKGKKRHAFPKIRESHFLWIKLNPSCQIFLRFNTCVCP